MASKQQIPQILTDAPDTQLMNWLGYSAKKDKTMLPAQFLVEPSQNCFIPDGDKIVPRFGTKTVFQGSNPILNDGTIGGYVKYKNFAGIEMDVKAYRDATEGEQVYVLFQGVYVPITINPNTSLNGTGKIYFSTYNDTNLDISLSKRISRLVWVNGYEDKGVTPNTGRAFSWTGGISPIATIAANVITIPAGKTFRELGFTEFFPTATQIRVTINGTEFFSTNLAELDGNTLTLNANPTAVPGDIVTSAVEVDDLVAPMQLLKQNKNYMFYGNEMFRQWFMSNQYARPSVTRITESNASQDDLIIDPSTNYTGTGRNIYKLVISDIHPAINTEEQIFVSPTGGQNNESIVTSGYTGGTGKNVYRISFVSNIVLTPTAGTHPNPFADGEIVVGQTSGAYGTFLPGTNDFAGGAAYTDMALNGKVFLKGETILGQGSTPQPTAVLFAVIPGNTIKFYKNNVEFVPAGFTPAYSYPSIGPFTNFIDGLSIDFPISDYGAHQVGDYIELTIQKDPGAPDQFTWQKNNGTVSAPAPVSMTPILIEDGIFTYWVKDTGHAIGDFWLIEVNQIITRPWANFYYSIDIASKNSVRRPGEGYLYSLPSNFWTMDTFEEAMYVNTSNGEWGYTTPILSADLLSEDITFTPLKQMTSSKVLFPYLTGHNRNDLVFIDENKNLNSIGRLVLLEKVQMETMSNFVLNAFQKNSWVNGSIIFQENSLWLTSPEDNIMLVFNERTKYWQPPQYIPNLGILTIIGTSLYTHSHLNTATRSLNDPTAIGDDGVEYEVIARSSTFAHGNRWNKKTTNMGFWEGYIFKIPPMKMKAYFDVDGCAGIKKTDIIPVFCSDVVNDANFGGAQHGKHEFGSDGTLKTNYARFQWQKLGVHHFYFSSIEFTCRTDEHTYEILSMGLNLSQSKINNKDYRPPESAADQLLPI